MKIRHIIWRTLLVSMLFVAFSSNASEEEVPLNFQSSQWVKVFGYILEPSSQLGPVPFSSLSIYVANDSEKSDKAWAVYSKSDLTHFMSSEDTSVKVLEVPRSKYFKLLDLASKEAGIWELFVYDKLGYCHMPKKQLVFNGKVQSILSICGYETNLKPVSERVLMLTEEMETILKKVEKNGKHLSASDYTIGFSSVD